MALNHKYIEFSELVLKDASDLSLFREEIKRLLDSGFVLSVQVSALKSMFYSSSEPSSTVNNSTKPEESKLKGYYYSS